MLIIVLVADAAQNAMSAGYTSLTKEATRPIVEVVDSVRSHTKGSRPARSCMDRAQTHVFTEWTSHGSIRHPSFQGLREDKKAKDVVRQLPNAVPMEAKKRKPVPTAKTKR